MIFAKMYLEHITCDRLIDALNSNENITYWAFILHDKDANIVSGELKKEHFHIIIDYIPPDKKGSKIFMTKLFTPEERSGSDIQCVRNAIKCHRYLLHLDNKEKYQYSIEEIQTSNVELLEEYLQEQIKESKREKAINDILDYCENEFITNQYITYIGLIQFCRENNILDYYISKKAFIDKTIEALFDMPIINKKSR